MYVIKKCLELGKFRFNLTGKSWETVRNTPFSYLYHNPTSLQGVFILQSIYHWPRIAPAFIQSLTFVACPCTNRYKDSSRVKSTSSRMQVTRMVNAKAIMGGHWCRTNLVHIVLYGCAWTSTCVGSASVVVVAVVGSEILLNLYSQGCHLL